MAPISCYKAVSKVFRKKILPRYKCPNPAPSAKKDDQRVQAINLRCFGPPFGTLKVWGGGGLLKRGSKESPPPPTQIFCPLPLFLLERIPNNFHSYVISLCLTISPWPVTPSHCHRITFPSHVRPVVPFHPIILFPIALLTPSPICAALLCNRKSFLVKERRGQALPR